MAYISKCKHGKYIAMCDDCYPKTKLQQGWEKGYAEMNKQHKWHKEIKAWADGAEIEVRVSDSNHAYIWAKSTEMYPRWDASDREFRIKPQPKEPQYLYAHRTNEGDITFEIDEGVSVVGYQYIGKIKLEVDDDN